MDLMLGIICSHVVFAATHLTQNEQQTQYIVNSRDNLLHYALSPICLHSGLQLVLGVIYLELKLL